MSRELGDLGSGMSLMLDLILNRPCLVSPFLCFVCSFGAVTSLSEDREIGKASDGWSTSCSMSVIKSGGNQGERGKEESSPSAARASTKREFRALNRRFNQNNEINMDEGEWIEHQVLTRGKGF